MTTLVIPRLKHMLTPTQSNTQYDYFMEVGFNSIEGLSVIAAMGHNKDVDETTLPEDLWAPGGVYNWISSPSPLQIVSSSVLDSSNSTGAREVTIYGLDDNYREIVEVVGLNGTTPVNLTNLFFRINRAYVTKAGTDKRNMGNIDIKSSSSQILRCRLEQYRNESLQAVYTVPKNHQFQLYTLQTSLNRNNSGSKYYTVYINVIGADGIALTPFEVGCTEEPYQRNILPGLLLGEKTDVILSVVLATANNLDITAGFAGILKRVALD